MKRFPPQFVASLLNVSLGQVGKMEVGKNGGDAVRSYQSATWLAPDSWPWCAAFVCWCIRAASLNIDLQGVDLPETPRAFGFEEWGKDNAILILNPSHVSSGDLVIYQFPSGGHIGIAVSSSFDGHFQVVEGNTGPDGGRDGDGVYLKNRNLDFVRSLVRF